MKFKRVQFNHYGSASEMYMGEYELPQLKQNDVQVRVKAAAINPLDWKQRQGVMKLFMSRQFPKGIGSDFAGVVEAVGEDVHDIRPGDEVLGTMDVKKPGAFAEVVVTESRYVTKKPSGISFAEAACLPIPAATAWAALLLGKKPVTGNSRVLINGCTGAVGSMAVQLAIANGAKVTGTCSLASMEFARLMGVQETFDYADKQFDKYVKPFDVIFDTAGTMNIGRAVRMLKPKGMIVDINPTPGRIVRGLLSRRYRMVFANMAYKFLPEIADLADQDLLRSAIGQQTDFSQAITTITAFEKGQRSRGRVVLTF